MNYEIEKCLLCKRSLSEDEKIDGVCGKCEIREESARHKHKEKDE